MIEIVAQCGQISALLPDIVHVAVQRFPDDRYASKLEGEIGKIRLLLDAFVCVQYAPTIPEFMPLADDELGH